MTVDVKDLRAGQRYVLENPLSAMFGATEVQIVNISSGGVQIIHPLPQRIGSAARVAFRIGDVSVSTSGRLIWSHLAKTPNKLAYRSGIRIEDLEFAAAVQTLVDRDFIKADTESLDRKRQRLIQKERERSDKHLVKVVPAETALSSEQLLLIQHARERLRANPAEAMRLYEQARTADAANGVREDAVAVWEYLERTIALPTISKVFDGKN